MIDTQYSRGWGLGKQQQIGLFVYGLKGALLCLIGIGMNVCWEV